MTRPPPFSPLSVCPKPLPGSASVRNADAGTGRVFAPSFRQRAQRYKSIVYFITFSPSMQELCASFCKESPRRQSARAGSTYPNMLVHAGICKRRTVGGNSRRRAGIIRGLHRDEAKPTGQRRKSGPAPLRVQSTRSGAGPRCAAGLRSTTVIGSRPDRRSDPHAAADALPSKKPDGILIADPPHKRRSRGSVLRRPYDFSERFVLPSLAFP